MEWTPEMEQNPFLTGFVYGLITAGMVGFFLNAIRMAWFLLGSPWRRMTVVHRTERTPWQVLMLALRNGFAVIFWVFGFALALGMIVFGLYNLA